MICVRRVGELVNERLPVRAVSKAPATREDAVIGSVPKQPAALPGLSQPIVFVRSKTANQPTNQPAESNANAYGPSRSATLLGSLCSDRRTFDGFG